MIQIYLPSPSPIFITSSKIYLDPALETTSPPTATLSDKLMIKTKSLNLFSAVVYVS
jgi:hypothetical protein